MTSWVSNKSNADKIKIFFHNIPMQPFMCFNDQDPHLEKKSRSKTIMILVCLDYFMVTGRLVVVFVVINLAGLYQTPLNSSGVIKTLNDLETRKE